MKKRKNPKEISPDVIKGSASASQGESEIVRTPNVDLSVNPIATEAETPLWLQGIHFGSLKAVDFEAGCWSIYAWIKTQAKYLKFANAEDREDFCSEAFIRVRGQLPHFRGRSTLKTYVCRIAMNTYYSHAKAECKKAKIANAGEFAITATDRRELPYMGRGSLGAINHAVKDAIKRLSPVEHKVISGVMDDMSLSEIAEVLQKSVSNVKVIKHRAIRKIKNIVNEQNSRDEQ